MKFKFMRIWGIGVSTFKADGTPRSLLQKTTTVFVFFGGNGENFVTVGELGVLRNWGIDVWHDFCLWHGTDERGRARNTRVHLTLSCSKLDQYHHCQKNTLNCNVNTSDRLKSPQKLKRRWRAGFHSLLCANRVLRTTETQNWSLVDADAAFFPSSF